MQFVPHYGMYFQINSTQQKTQQPRHAIFHVQRLSVIFLIYILFFTTSWSELFDFFEGKKFVNKCNSTATTIVKS